MEADGDARQGVRHPLPILIFKIRDLEHSRKQFLTEYEQLNQRIDVCLNWNNLLMSF